MRGTTVGATCRPSIDVAMRHQSGLIRIRRLIFNMDRSELDNSLLDDINLCVQPKFACSSVISVLAVGLPKQVPQLRPRVRSPISDRTRNTPRSLLPPSPFAVLRRREGTQFHASSPPASPRVGHPTTLAGNSGAWRSFPHPRVVIKTKYFAPFLYFSHSKWYVPIRR